MSTYVQSGNLVFVPRQSTAKVAEALRAAIAETTPARPDVMVRTRAELHDIIAANPFLSHGTDPQQLRVICLPDQMSASLDGIDLARFARRKPKALSVKCSSACRTALRRIRW